MRSTGAPHYSLETDVEILTAAMVWLNKERGPFSGRELQP
jgi:hypothetical protein